MPDEPNTEIPHQKKLASARNMEDLIKKAADWLQLDMERCTKGRRLQGEDKQRRDLLIYWLRKTGWMSNNDIGGHFGMSYSAVSHSAAAITRRMDKDDDLRLLFDQLNSQFKI